MRESRTYGSVRGALSNERPYRDRCARNDGLRLLENSIGNWNAQSIRESDHLAPLAYATQRIDAPATAWLTGSSG